MKLRRNVVVIGLIWFSCFIWFPSSGSAGGDQVQYFPHLAFGGGYDSTWQFTGLGAGTATVTVEFEGRNFTTSPVLRGRMPTASDRAGLLDAILALKQGLDAALDEFLGPDPSDVVPYAAFLLQSDTGMTRLVPRETYDHVLPIVGGGAYYSFYRLTHEYGYGSDLSLEQGRLKVGFAGYDFGFLTDLGNVPVDQVAVDHPGLQYLHSYVPPSVDADIRAEQQRAGLGFTVGPYYYRSSLPAKLDTTYVLRSMNYLESDLLVVFRIVRIDSDGSVILVWRKLATYPVPHYQ
jgi:hypothetical protein